MSARVLREHGVQCDQTVPAALSEHRLEIDPRADLVPDENSIAYGGLAHVQKLELDSLYQGLEDSSGLVYKPQVVKVKTLEGEERDAVCYICGRMAPAQADPEYIEEMVNCCEELELPTDYVLHVKSFRP